MLHAAGYNAIFIYFEQPYNNIITLQQRHWLPIYMTIENEKDEVENLYFVLPPDKL